MIKIYGTIYHVTNLMNGKIYIGQTINSYHQRCKEHFNKLVQGKHCNEHLQSSFDMHGADKFTTGSIYHAYSKEELDGWEDQYIDWYSSMNDQKGYNLKSGGAGGIPSEEIRKKIGIASRNRTPETLAKMSAAKKGKKLTADHRAKMSNYSKNRTPDHLTKIKEANTGKKRTPEQRAKISTARKGTHHSLETRAKISAANTGRKLPPFTLEHRAKMSAARKRRASKITNT